MAIKTALFLAEILFRHTLATKSAYFLAVCSTFVQPNENFFGSEFIEIKKMTSI